MTDTYTSDELNEMDLWETVNHIKAKIELETMNDDKHAQALLIAFEINQVIDELLDFSIDFTRRLIVHKT